MYFQNILKLRRSYQSIKKGDPKQCNRIVYNQLNDFLTKHNILYPNQYGFRKHFSTETAILDLYDRITNAIAQNKYVIGLFFDISKAFDTLNHNILLYKLNHYGVRGAPLAWFNSYLSNRKQFIEL